jgi:two-component system chemotaxis response regulator CheY
MNGKSNTREEMNTILIVDHSALTRQRHTQILGSDEYRLVEAASGAEAIEVFAHERPELVVTELLLPDMDGMEAVKAIRARDASVNVVVCSADKQKYRKQQAKELGAVAFLIKPINGKRLREVVQTIFTREDEETRQEGEERR